MKQCAFSETVHSLRNMSIIAPEMTRTPRSHHAPASVIHPCHDPQQVSIGHLADLPHPTNEMEVNGKVWN